MIVVLLEQMEYLKWSKIILKCLSVSLSKTVFKKWSTEHQMCFEEATFGVSL